MLAHETINRSVGMVEREAELGRPLNEAIVDLYAEHRSLDKVA